MPHPEERLTGASRRTQSTDAARNSDPASAVETQLPLLDRPALGEIAGLVDIGAFEDGGVVGQELHRDRVEQRRYKRRALRHRDAEGAAAVEPGDAHGV